jgi:hypothetical protein
MKNKLLRDLLSKAVAPATPSCAGMFTNVREGAERSESANTKPTAHPPAPSTTARSAPPVAPAKTNPNKPIAGAREGAETCGNVRERAAATARAPYGTNPTPRDKMELTPRQVAAARLLALGRCGRAVAAEIGVNEHTVTRWRRVPAFATEVRRQHELVLAEQVRQRRTRSTDDYAAVAEQIARKYGMVR